MIFTHNIPSTNFAHYRFTVLYTDLGNNHDSVGICVHSISTGKIYTCEKMATNERGMGGRGGGGEVWWYQRQRRLPSGCGSQVGGA